MQNGVKQHGSMAIGKHETVTIPPTGVGGIVFHVVVPKDFGNVSHTHGSTGVA